MENVLDVLLYLFENYLEGELEDGSNHATLKDELTAAGFPQREIEHAFDWLEGLRLQRELPLPSPTDGAMRLYAREESGVIPTECQGFLLHLEHLGILSAANRERVIERLMALAAKSLDQASIDLDDLKWIVLMVLFNQPADQAAGAELEEMLYSYEANKLH